MASTEDKNLQEIAQLLKKLIETEQTFGTQNGAKLDKLINSTDTAEDGKKKRFDILNQEKQQKSKLGDRLGDKLAEKTEGKDKDAIKTDTSLGGIVESILLGKGLGPTFFTGIIKKGLNAPLKFLSKGMRKGVAGALKLLDFGGIFSKISKKLLSGVGKVPLVGPLIEKSITFLFKNAFKMFFGALNILALPALIWSFIRGYVWEWVQGNALGEKIFGIFDGILTPINNFFDGVVDVVVGIFTLNSDKVATGIKNAFGGLWDLFKGLLRFIIVTVEGVFPTLKDAFFKLFQTPIKYLTKQFDKVKEWLNGDNTFAKFLKNIVDSIYKFFTEIVKGWWEDFKKNNPRFAAVVDKISNSVSDFFTDVSTVPTGQMADNKGNVEAVVANIPSKGETDLPPAERYSSIKLSKSTEADKEFAIKYLRENGNMSLAQAQGVVANLIAESGLQPNGKPGDNGKAYGIAQWHPDRQAKFAEIIGRPIRDSSLPQQLEFLIWEMNNTEKKAGKALRATTSASEAAGIFDKLFERSDGKSTGARMALANEIANTNPVTAGNKLANVNTTAISKTDSKQNMSKNIPVVAGNNIPALNTSTKFTPNNDEEYQAQSLQLLSSIGNNITQINYDLDSLPYSASLASRISGEV